MSGGRVSTALMAGADGRAPTQDLEGDLRSLEGDGDGDAVTADVGDEFVPE
jgi:hypothetical protein